MQKRRSFSLDRKSARRFGVQQHDVTVHIGRHYAHLWTPNCCVDVVWAVWAATDRAGGTVNTNTRSMPWSRLDHSKTFLSIHYGLIAQCVNDRELFSRKLDLLIIASQMHVLWRMHATEREELLFGPGSYVRGPCVRDSLQRSTRHLFLHLCSPHLVLVLARTSTNLISIDINNIN